MTTNYDLNQRMSFMRLDEPSGRALRSIKPIVERSLPGALDVFYGQLRQYPEVKRFFSDDRAIESAGARQQRHWGNISSAEFNDDYVRSVRTIGQVHARIGLEPRWYIGGYALITEQLIRATLKERLPKGGLLTKPLKDADLADPIVALIKAVMLDMDFSISIYIEALDDERKAKEAALAEAEQQQSALVEALAKALAELSNGDLTTRLTQKFAPQYTKLQDDFNGAMEQLQNTMAVIGQASDGIRSGTNEISMASDDLSRRTENQAASLEQAAAALGEITST
ncbi:MAG: protoglobin domain-containing protein, partial [Caulobacteraceae bacterium]|nr:protoglobin domain-containing protein [Caulobacteraceae bacterium]